MALFSPLLKVVYITAKVTFMFIFQPEVHIYDLHTLTVVYSSLYGFITSQHHDSWLVSSVGIVLHRGSTYLGPYFHYFLSRVNYCQDRFLIHFLTRSSHIWFQIFIVIWVKTGWESLVPLIKVYCGMWLAYVSLWPNILCGGFTNTILLL